ncbi:hypothetical protein H5410_062128 [Solanum commersonii]|uniref:Uncharacterized protein n=1 Tax=Solanum commersonii TaxID=4109 RepID=A0A9J5W9Z7_SOLCO|nr:hypothetical protein H5410_062128 [Solanum commersonii]
MNTKSEKLKPSISLQGMDKINKKLDVLDAKVNKLSDTVSDLRVVVEESRKNDNVGDGQLDKLAKKKIVDHQSIIDPSSPEIFFIKMRQLDKNQKNSKIQIARFILLFEVQKKQILTSVDMMGIKTGVVFSSLDHGICASPADVNRTVSVVSFQDTSSPLDDRTCDYQVDACKHVSPTGVGVVPSSLDRGFMPLLWTSTELMLLPSLKVHLLQFEWCRFLFSGSWHLLLSADADRTMIVLATLKWMLANMPLLWVLESFPFLRIKAFAPFRNISRERVM